jgi:hypothetical protein
LEERLAAISAAHAAHAEKWRGVTGTEFETFLRDYPRPLEARPPLFFKANYREWVDPTVGAWPEGAVAKGGSAYGYHLRR